MSPRTLPTSRAYWELRAEQVMDRVFTPTAAVDTEVSPAGDDPDAPIDVLVHDEGPGTSPPHRPPGPTRRRRPWPLHRWPAGWNLSAPLPARSRQLAAFSGAVCLCLAMGGLSLLFWRNWTVARQDLRQERNLLLLERLRALGPAATADATDNTDSDAAKGGPSDAPDPAGAIANADQLPPPPSEAWMEELAALPQSSAPPAEVLRVPMTSGISRPAPAASGGGGGGSSAGGGGGGGGLPQLVGVVQVPGRPGSAIFQMGGSSSSASVGENIGGSGWRLQSANGDTAVIERGGEQRQVSISSGF